MTTQAQTPQAQAVQHIPLTQLVPWQNGGKGQPRKHFDPQALQELADSMTVGGFIGSIAVRPCPGRPGEYEILAGHRRTKAAALAHLEAIPATVHNLDDVAARFFVLQDNLQRQDFLPWEEGEGFAELVADGAAVAAVAGKCGKSPSYVAGRIAIHEGAGGRARELYLRKELTMEALSLVAALPDRDLSPVRCPSCKAVCGEQFAKCPACSADLSSVARYPSGNPQSAAAMLCRGKVNGAVKELVEKVLESYGLSAAPVQTSLGLSTVQISEEAIKVRSALERKLSEVAALSQWALDHAKDLCEYTADQRAAIAAQCEAAVRVFTRIAETVAPAEGETPALALDL